MIPCLYNQSENLFSTNGIGKLCDAVSCIVTEKRNGAYELKMTYPLDGLHVDHLIEDNIILAKPSEQGDPQPFRIYHVSTPLHGLLEINARHISYQQNQITVSPFTAGNAHAAMSGLGTNSASACPFTFETDIESNKQFTVSVPSTIRSCLGSMENSILETYGGEFEWDMYRTILHAHRGSDRGVKILYGKNLIDFQMERSIDSLMTGVHPYWYKQDTETGEETLIELPEKIITVNIGQTFERIEPLNCSSVFSREPTLEQIRDYARWYLQDEKFSRPNADIKINFSQLWRLPGYEDIVEAERVSLCDTVHVFISRINLEISYKVTETEYNVLLERYDSIVLSNETVRSKNRHSYFVGTIADLQAQADATEAATLRNSTDIQQVSYTVRDEVNGLESTISETASQIRSEVSDTANGLNSSITETASQIRSEVSDSVNGLNSSITETASQIRSEVSDSVNGLTSSITETASQIRSEVSDSVNGLNSSITETASQIRSEVSDSVNGLTSSITETASQIRSEVSDSVNGLSSSITETASQIRSEVSDSVNGLSSSITETASQIRSEVSDSVNGLTSSITETASQIRSEVSDSVNGLSSSITETASQIRSEVSDSVNGINSSITQTASQIRTEVSDSVNELNSSITQTASQIRSEVSDSVNGLSSSITETASQIRSEVSDSVNGLTSSITETASQIRSEVSDSVNGLNSSITETASQIRSEVSDSVNGLTSSITETASQIRSEVSDSVNGLTSSITETASQIRSEVSDSVNGLNSSITETASQIRSEVSDSVNGLNSSITETASQIRSEVSDNINGLNSSITQTASQIRAEISDSVNGLSSSITQTASQIRSEVSDSVNGLNSSITQNANRISLVIDPSNNKIKAAAIVTEINNSASSVIISASHVTIDGTVNLNDVMQIYSNYVWIKKKALFGADIATNYDVYIDNGTVEAYQYKTTRGGKLTLYGASGYSVDVNFTNAASMITELQFVESSGRMYLQKKTALNTNWHDAANFKIADTQTYIDGVSAAWIDASDTVDLQGRLNGSGSFASIKGQSYSSGISLSYGDYYEVKTVYKTGPSNPDSSITRRINAPSMPSPTFAWRYSSKTAQFGVNLNNSASGLYGTLQSNGADGVEMVSGNTSYADFSLDILLEGKHSSDSDYSSLNSRTPVTLSHGETYNIRASWNGKSSRSSISTTITAPASDYSSGFTDGKNAISVIPVVLSGNVVPTDSGGWSQHGDATVQYTDGTQKTGIDCYGGVDVTAAVNYGRSMGGGTIDIPTTQIYTTSSAPSGATLLTTLRNRFIQAQNDSDFVVFRVDCGSSQKWYYMEP